METKKQTINTLLGLTEEKYEDLYFGNYMRWGESVSINDLQLQMVLANTSVNKYYNMEYGKLEAEFLELAANYPEASHKDMQELYATCTFGMFNKRCPVLIDQAKKLNLQQYEPR